MSLKYIDDVLSVFIIFRQKLCLLTSYALLLWVNMNFDLAQNQETAKHFFANQFIWNLTHPNTYLPTPLVINLTKLSCINALHAHEQSP